jgi:hypothetical protein
MRENWRDLLTARSRKHSAHKGIPCLWHDLTMERLSVVEFASVPGTTYNLRRMADTSYGVFATVLQCRIVRETIKLLRGWRMTQAKTFAHRYAETGGIESICLTCFLSTASSRDTEEMLRNETQHACEERPVKTFEKPLLKSPMSYLSLSDLWAHLVTRRVRISCLLPIMRHVAPVRTVDPQPALIIRPSPALTKSPSGAAHLF